MTKTPANAPQAEIAATAPTGPAPTQPQGAPAGAVQIGDSYVEPLAAPTDSARRKAPFAFVDGVLAAQDPVVVAPQRVAQPDALTGATRR